MKILFLCYCLLFLFTIALSAQTYEIYGTVSDSLTQKALSIANIICYDAENQFFITGTVSGESGRFCLKGLPTGKYRIEISYLGYHSKSLPVQCRDNGPADLGNIVLNTVPYPIGEVKVIFKPLVEYRNDDEVILNLDMLGNVEEKSVLDIIHSLTGLYTDFDDNIRYNGYSDFTILIDGKKMGSRYMRISGSRHMESYFLRSIPAKYIKTVEILPDPKGKYGYYTPIINLIPKGDLRDFINFSGEAGISEKYGGGFGITRVYKKLSVSPEISSRYPAFFTREKEEREYIGSSLTSFSRQTDVDGRNDENKMELKTRYDFNDKRFLMFTAGGNLNENNISTRRNTMYTGGENSFTREILHSGSPGYNFTLNYSDGFYVGQNKNLRLNVKVSTDKDKENSKQKITDQGGENILQQYRSDRNMNSQTANMQLNYFNFANWFTYQINSGIFWDRRDESSGRDVYEQATGNWNELTLYSADQSFSRLSTQMSVNLSRRFDVQKKNLKVSHFFKAGINEGLNYESSMNKLSDTAEKERDLKTQAVFSYRRTTSYGWLVLNYNGNINRPTSSQLVESPVYIDNYSMKKGNPGLKPELVHSFMVDYTWNDANVMTVTKDNHSSAPPYGFSIRGNYSSTTNKIVENHTVNENGILVYSYKNCNGIKSLILDGSIYTRVSTFMNIETGARYRFDTFNDDNLYLHSGSSWSLNALVNVRIMRKVKVEARYQFNSPAILYQRKNYAYHDGSFLVEAPVWKGNINLTAEAANLLATKGKRSVLYGENFLYRKTVYPETPVIWFHASLLLFKFVKK